MPFNMPIVSFEQKQVPWPIFLFQQESIELLNASILMKKCACPWSGAKGLCMGIGNGG